MRETVSKWDKQPDPRFAASLCAPVNEFPFDQRCGVPAFHPAPVPGCSTSAPGGEGTQGGQHIRGPESPRVHKGAGVSVGKGGPGYEASRPTAIWRATRASSTTRTKIELFTQNIIKSTQHIESGMMNVLAPDQSLSEIWYWCTILEKAWQACNEWCETLLILKHFWKTAMPHWVHVTSLKSIQLVRLCQSSCFWSWKSSLDSN